MSQGVYALIGVVIGAVLSGGVQLLLGVWQDRQRRRLAARVLVDELSIVLREVEAARAHERVSRGLNDAAGQLRDAWRERRDALHGIAWTSWVDIEAAVVAAATLPSIGEWTDEVDGNLEILDSKLTPALNALVPHVAKRTTFRRRSGR